MATARVQLPDGRIATVDLGNNSPQINVPQPQQQKQNFMQNEVQGNQSQKTGLLGQIFQSTLGSKGVMGAAQLPGLIFGQPTALKAQTDVSNSSQGLADATTKLIQQRRQETDPQKISQLTDMINGNFSQLQDNNSQVNNLQGFVRTPGQAVGTAINAATTLAPFAGGAGAVGLGTVPQLAEGMSQSSVPLISQVGQVLASKGIGPALGRIATRGVLNEALGNISGFGQGLANGENLQQSNQTASHTGNLSALLGMGTGVASEVTKALTNPNVQKTLYNMAIGAPKKLVAAGKSPAADMIEQGQMGSAASLAARQQPIIDQSNGKISNILQKSDKTVKLNDVYQTVADKINSYNRNATGDGITPEDIQKVIQGMAPNVKTLLSGDETPIESANHLRSLLDGLRSNRSFFTSQLPDNQFILKGVADELRNTVQNMEPGTKSLFSQQSKAITALNLLTDEASKNHVIRHLASMATGVASMGPSIAHGDVGGALLGLIAPIANEAAFSTTGQTAAAVGMNRLNNVLTNGSAPTNVAQNVMRTAIQHLLGGQ